MFGTTTRLSQVICSCISKNRRCAAALSASVLSSHMIVCMFLQALAATLGLGYLVQLVYAPTRMYLAMVAGR